MFILDAFAFFIRSCLVVSLADKFFTVEPWLDKFSMWLSPKAMYSFSEWKGFRKRLGVAQTLERPTHVEAEPIIPNLQL